METAINESPCPNGTPTGEGLTFEKVWAMIQEMSQEAKRREEILDRRFEKTERFSKRLSKQMGDLHNSFGEISEHLVVPSIHKRFNELGYHFGGVLPGGVTIYSPNGKIKTQIDILLENDDTVMAIEIKSKVKEQDVEHHIRCLEILCDYRRKNNDFRNIQGAIAGAIFGTMEKQATIAAGLYVIEQSGDTMKIDIPDNFVPREW